MVGKVDRQLEGSRNNVLAAAPSDTDRRGGTPHTQRPVCAAEVLERQCSGYSESADMAGRGRGRGRGRAEDADLSLMEEKAKRQGGNRPAGHPHRWCLLAGGPVAARALEG